MANQGFNQNPGNKMMNGHPDVSQASLSNKNDIDMLEQIKQLLVENNKLKETMKQKNQEMKERLEDLLNREKQREEQASSEPGLLEGKQRLLELSNENELLKKEIQHLKQITDLSTQNSDGSASEGETENLKQLKAQLLRLQAEKADLLGMISELQIKLSSCASDDSFVEIRIAEKEVGAELKENKVDDRASNHDIISYRTNLSDGNHAMESEELAVSKLLHSLREETEKVEQLQRELVNANERLSELENKSSDYSDKETETEPVVEQNDKEVIESEKLLSEEVDTLKQKVAVLNKELSDTNEKLNVAQLVKNKLQERCLSLDKKLMDNQVNLDERQKLLYSVQMLELHVESLKSEIKMEQSKTEEQKKLVTALQEAFNKQKCDYELLRNAEAEKVSKVQFCELQQKLDAYEQALAKKQLEIDEMKEIVTKHQEDVETIVLLRTQMEVYCSDFHAERLARESIHQEKEQLASRLAYILQENENCMDESQGRPSIEELQRRHRSMRPSDSSESSFLVSRGAENMEQQRFTVHTCPKCQLTVPDIDTLQIHVMDCIT
ncbi:optineurin [Mixophyes fleayi]|uniref:optineurin n=1 Tax=Mixophyes fleayi TaxID=3061075 RepID=UPI003F4E3EAB